MNTTAQNSMRGTTPSTTVSSLAPGTWHVDPDHSGVTFRVKAMWGLITVTGRVKVLDGTVHLDEALTPHGRLRANATTLDTGIRMRDGHLRSADFLDVKRYPYMEFSVRNLTDAGGGHMRIAGDLVMRGTAYPLNADAMVRDVGDDMVEITARASVERAVIDRSLKRGRVIKGPTHLAARIRFVRDNERDAS